MTTLNSYLVENSELSMKQADVVVNLTKMYIKERVPKILHSNIEEIFNGNSLQGSFKERINEMGDELQNHTDSLASDLKETLDRTFGTKKKD